MAYHSFNKRLQEPTPKAGFDEAVIVPPQRQRYLAEIAEAVRDYHADTARQAGVARELQQLGATRTLLGADQATATRIDELIDERAQVLAPRCRKLLKASTPSVASSSPRSPPASRWTATGDAACSA